MTNSSRPWTYATIVRRLTGVSTPVLGISWSPPVDDRAIVHRFFARVGDRRLLGNSVFYAIPLHLSNTVSSVLAIQAAVTQAMEELGPDAPALLMLEDIRAASHDFRDYIDDLRGDNLPDLAELHVEVQDAVTRLRTRIGCTLAMLAETYHLPASGSVAAAIERYHESGVSPNVTQIAKGMAATGKPLKRTIEDGSTGQKVVIESKR